MVLGHKKSAPV